MISSVDKKESANKLTFCPILKEITFSPSAKEIVQTVKSTGVAQPLNTSLRESPGISDFLSMPLTVKVEKQPEIV